MTSLNEQINDLMNEIESLQVNSNSNNLVNDDDEIKELENEIKKLEDTIENDNSDVLDLYSQKRVENFIDFTKNSLNFEDKKEDKKEEINKNKNKNKNKIEEKKQLIKPDEYINILETEALNNFIDLINCKAKEAAKNGFTYFKIDKINVRNTEFLSILKNYYEINEECCMPGVCCGIYVIHLKDKSKDILRNRLLTLF